MFLALHCCTTVRVIPATCSRVIAFHCGAASSRHCHTFSPMSPLLLHCVAIVAVVAVRAAAVWSLRAPPPSKQSLKLRSTVTEQYFIQEVHTHHGLQTLPCSTLTLSASCCCCLGRRFIAADHEHVQSHAKIQINSLV